MLQYTGCITCEASTYIHIREADMMNESFNKPGVEIPPELQHQVAVTTLDRIYNWARTRSLWPMMFGLACCAIEMIMLAASRFDSARHGHQPIDL
jgi:NADH-quinone oxidoreductase subunit B